MKCANMKVGLTKGMYTFLVVMWSENVSELPQASVFFLYTSNNEEAGITS